MPDTLVAVPEDVDGADVVLVVEPDGVSAVDDDSTGSEEDVVQADVIAARPRATAMPTRRNLRPTLNPLTHPRSPRIKRAQYAAVLEGIGQSSTGNWAPRLSHLVDGQGTAPGGARSQ
jgi:hypothetical protein